MAALAVEVKVRKGGGTGVPAMMRRIERNTEDATQGFADTTKTSARRRCHVITGRLRDSIDSFHLDANHWVVRVGMYYGVYEEMGTRYRPPHPYFRPAAAEAKVKFHADMLRVFTR